jgi:hypothetical protein
MEKMIKYDAYINNLNLIVQALGSLQMFFNTKAIFLNYGFKRLVEPWYLGWPKK